MTSESAIRHTAEIQKELEDDSDYGEKIFKA